MKKKRKLKKKFVAFIFLYFVIISSIFIMRTISKFSTSINENASVDVASWNVSSNLPNATVTLVPVVDYTYNLSVTSNSDVAVSYSIKVSNLATNTFVILDGNKLSDGSSSVTFSNVGTINANASTKTKNHKLKFKVAPEVTESTNRNVKIDVIFTQNIPG